MQEVKMAEFVHFGGKLCLLWLVGLEVSGSYCDNLIEQLPEWSVYTAL